MRRLALLLFAGACARAQSEPAPPAPSAPRLAPGAPSTGPAARTAPAARPQLGDPAIAGAVTRVAVVAAVGAGPATDRPTYARADQRVTLYAAVEVSAGKARTWFTDAPVLELGGRRVPARPLAQAPVIALTWNRIEPAQANLSNGDPSTFHFEPIDYRPTELAGSTNLAQVPADVRPTLTLDHGDGVGTMRFQVIARQGDHTIASPGTEARRGKGSGGLTDAVLRVSIRKDDTYLGYLTEMYGQPYVWASAGLSTATHQSERLEGSDCADFVVYGARRMGRNIAYTWTGGLPSVSKLLAAGTRGADGVYRDRGGHPLPFTRIGDLVLFPRHVGVLDEDRGTLGVLDDADLIMHTLFDTPKAQPLADSGYADEPLELRRFTPDLRPARSPG